MMTLEKIVLAVWLFLLAVVVVFAVMGQAAILEFAALIFLGAFVSAALAMRRLALRMIEQGQREKAEKAE